MDRWNLVPVLDWWSAFGLFKPSLLLCCHSVILQGRLNVPIPSNGMKGDCSLRWYDFSNPLRPFSHPHIQWVLWLRGAGPVPHSLNCESEHTLRVESSGFPGEAKTLSKGASYTPCFEKQPQMVLKSSLPGWLPPLQPWRGKGPFLASWRPNCILSREVWLSVTETDSWYQRDPGRKQDRLDNQQQWEQNTKTPSPQGG